MFTYDSTALSCGAGVWGVVAGTEGASLSNTLGVWRAEINTTAHEQVLGLSDGLSNSLSNGLSNGVGKSQSGEESKKGVGELHFEVLLMKKISKSLV